MAVDEQLTPIPPATLAPIRVEIGDWLNVQGNSSATVLDQQFQGQEQMIDVVRVGARPEDDVEVEVIGNFLDSRGSQQETQTLVTRATEDFNAPIESGPVATNRIRWRVVNNSATAFTDGGNDPYQTFLGYSIRPLTVVEKVRRSIPLTGEEEELAERVFLGQFLSIADRARLNLPPELDPAFQPNLEGKKVVETETGTARADIPGTGTENSVTVLDEFVRQDPQTNSPSDILYLTEFGGNWQEFSEDEDVQLRIIRDETEEVVRIKTFGLPGIGTGTGITSGVQAGTSQPPYISKVFIPFTNRMTVEAFANGSDPATEVEMRAKFARVDRDLVEKALYNLRNEVRTNDSFAQARLDLFEQIRRLLQAGLPITVDIQQAVEDVSLASAT